MSRRRKGFTMVELVIAILIGSILTSIALSSFNNAQGRFAVRGARSAFVSLHARARAQAIELGQNVILSVDFTGDSITLRTQDGATLDKLKYQNEFKVDLKSTSSSFRLCMNPRGFADEGCNTFSSALNVEFWQGADSSTVKVLPLGQLVY